MERGYLRLFRLRGIPIRAHWTLPLGVLMFSGGRMAPGLWLGIVTLIVLHELGHAYLVHRAGLVNLGIDITGFGGRCRWAGAPSPAERAGGRAAGACRAASGRGAGVGPAGSS